MSQTSSDALAIFFYTGLQDIRRNWGWVLAFGVALIIVGTIAISAAIISTLTSVVFFGAILLTAAAIEVIQTIWHRKAGHLFLHLLNAVLAGVVGFMLLANPLAGALVLTIVLAFYFLVAGAFRIVTGVVARFPSWGWVVFNGIITFALGIMILAGWPATGLWVLGLFLGVDLIINGWSRVMLALALRSLPATESSAPV